MELCLGMVDVLAGNLLVGIIGQMNVGNVVVGVHYRLPDQKVDEACRQLE